MLMDLPQMPLNAPGIAVVAKAEKLSLAPLALYLPSATASDGVEKTGSGCLRDTICFFTTGVFHVV